MPVQSVLGHQFLVGPLFHDPPVLQHDNLVGVANGRQTMGDDDSRSTDHQPLQGLLDQHLGFGIDRGRCLVQDQDGGISQHRSGDGQPLPLAAGELDPPLADQCFVPFRKLLDEVVGIRDTRCLGHLLICSTRAAE